MCTKPRCGPYAADAALAERLAAAQREAAVAAASLAEPVPRLPRSGHHNLPYDASGNLVRPNGFGTITGVRAPRTLQLVTRLTF